MPLYYYNVGIRSRVAYSAAISTTFILSLPIGISTDFRDHVRVPRRFEIATTMVDWIEQEENTRADVEGKLSPREIQRQDASWFSWHNFSQTIVATSSSSPSFFLVAFLFWLVARRGKGEWKRENGWNVTLLYFRLYIDVRRVQLVSLTPEYRRRSSDDFQKVEWNSSSAGNLFSRLSSRATHAFVERAAEVHFAWSFAFPPPPFLHTITCLRARKRIFFVLLSATYDRKPFENRRRLAATQWLSILGWSLPTIFIS